MSDTFEDRLADLTTSREYNFVARTFHHEDESVTVVLYDDDCEHANPRDNDCNVAHLVMQHRDYRELDDTHGGIEEARERWGEEGRVNLHCGYSRTPTRFTSDAETLTRRYLAIFYPEVLAYEPRWTVSGSTQSDWAYGYAYVLREDWDEAFPDTDPATGYPVRNFSELVSQTRTITPASCITQEVDVYGQYFAGEVFGYVHITPGDIEVITDIDGEHAECRYCHHGITAEAGGWVLAEGEADGDDAETYHDYCPDNHTERAAPHEPTRVLGEEDSCWGFLGYDSLKDIAAQATASPVTREVW